MPENLALNSNGIGPFFVLINWILNEPSLFIFLEILLTKFLTSLFFCSDLICHEVPNFKDLLARNGPKISPFFWVKKLQVNSLYLSEFTGTSFSWMIGNFINFIKDFNSLKFFIS